MPDSRATRPRAPGLAAPLIAAAAGVVVFWRALAFYFAQDDFTELARAAGLAPRLAGPSRYLSQQAFFDLMRRLSGLHASAYHAASLASHSACAVLLATVLAGVVAPPAAMLGAVFFATHPALFDGVYWISAIGGSLALLGGLGALLLASRGDRWRWASLPLFGLSLLAKESTLLLPLLAATGMRSARPKARVDRGVVIGLGVIALLDAIALGTGDTFGMRAGLPGTAPYAIEFGPHIGANALTYLGWTANPWLPTMRGFSDAVDPSVYAWGVTLLVLWLAGFGWRALRERGWGTAGVAFLCFLLPVLPLRNHSYHYYLYAPLVGVAWCVSAIADALISAGGGRQGNAANRALARAPAPGRLRPAWLLAGGASALLTLNGGLVVRKIETTPFVMPELRAEPVVDRARIARNVRDALAANPPLPGDTLLVWSPTAARLDPRGEPLDADSPRETYWERNVRGALDDGLAVRVMFPQVADVEFVRDPRPGAASTRVIVYTPDGLAREVTEAALDSIRALVPRASAAAPS